MSFETDYSVLYIFCSIAAIAANILENACIWWTSSYGKGSCLHTYVYGGWGKNVQKNALICTKAEREVFKCKFICSFLSPRREYNVMDQGSFE